MRSVILVILAGAHLPAASAFVPDEILQLQRLVTVTPDRPMPELRQQLDSAGIFFIEISRTGVMCLHVKESEWARASQVMSKLGFQARRSLPPMGLGLPYPEEIRTKIAEGNWNNVLSKLKVISRSTNEHPERALVDFEARAKTKKLTLPTAREWQGIDAQLSRQESISYLSRRIHIARGDTLVNGMCIPKSVVTISKACLDDQPAVLKVARPEGLIDPFRELYLKKVSIEEIRPFLVSMSVDHVLIPNSKLVRDEMRLQPATRYCLCVLLNSVLGRPNGIREFDLTDAEWGDLPRVIALVERVAGRDINLPPDSPE